jgi:hypothetical protein
MPTGTLTNLIERGKNMAHEISVVDGVAEAAFAGKPAWHGLGALVDGLMTPSQALDAAHLRWSVEKRPIYVRGAGDAFEPVPDKAATFRADTNEYLGTVGADWVPVQNSEQADFIAHHYIADQGNRRERQLYQRPLRTGDEIQRCHRPGDGSR